MHLVSTVLYTTDIGDVWETAVYDGLNITEARMRYSIWMPFLEGSQAAHADLLRKVQNEPAQQWAMTPDLLATVRRSAIEHFHIDEHADQ